MLYIVNVRIGEKSPQPFRIEAKDEEQIVERLKTRLAPKDRDNFVIDSVKLDPSEVCKIEPHGIFSEE